MSSLINIENNLVCLEGAEPAVITNENKLVAQIPDDTEIQAKKKEYAIVGDAFFATTSYESPPWLDNIVNNLFQTKFSTLQSNLSGFAQNLIDAVNSIELAKNSYTEAINIIESVDGVVVSKLEAYNATYDDNFSEMRNMQIAYANSMEAVNAKVETAISKAGAAQAEADRVWGTVASLEALPDVLAGYVADLGEQVGVAAAFEYQNFKAEIEENYASVEEITLAYADKIKALALNSSKVTARSGSSVGMVERWMSATADVIKGTSSAYGVKLMTDNNGIIDAMRISSGTEQYWDVSDPHSGYSIGDKLSVLGLLPENNVVVSIPAVEYTSAPLFGPAEDTYDEDFEVDVEDLPDSIPEDGFTYVTSKALVVGSLYHGHLVMEITRFQSSQSFVAYIEPKTGFGTYTPCPTGFIIDIDIYTADTVERTVRFTKFVDTEYNTDLSVTFKADAFSIYSPDGAVEPFRVDSTGGPGNSKVYMENVVVSEVDAKRVKISKTDGTKIPLVEEDEDGEVVLSPELIQLGDYMKIGPSGTVVSGSSKMEITQNLITISSSPDGGVNWVTRVKLGIW